MHTVTYSPEDNKLRLYVGRVPRDEYERLRAAGFVSTPKQDCDFAAPWTPHREDLAREYLDDDDIGDEDYSPIERAADRAERFTGYRDKRRAEAHGHADRFEDGPAAFGHQNAARAERQAERHDRHRTRAVSQWSKAEYWQQRTAGVIAAALHKAKPGTRRGRILKLEAEQRKHEADRDEYRQRYKLWQRVVEMDGSDELLPMADGYADCSAMNEAQRLAYDEVNHGGFREMFHPDSEAANEQARETHGDRCRGFSGYQFLTLDEYIRKPFRRMTPREFAALWLAGARDPDEYGSRWSAHFELRLTYENAMLTNEGGKVSEVDIVPGGWFGKHQVRGVNRSPVTKRVTSVKLWAPHPWKKDADGKAVMGLQSFNVERLGADAYRPPTDAELADYQAEEKARKATAKKARAKSPAPKLINPTPEDAQRLQDMLNAGESRDDRHSKTINSTQAAYSSQSKGNYAKCSTITIGEKGKPMGRHGNGQRQGVFKVRVCNAGWNADRVVIITDKPQKPLPFAAIAEARAQHPTDESHGQAFADLWARSADWGYEFNGLPDDEQDAAKQLRKDAGYLGWATIRCANQFELTDDGRAVLERWQQVETEATAEDVPEGCLF